VCLAIANTALVSGGMDGSIRVWNFNQAAGIFMSQVGAWGHRGQGRGGWAVHVVQAACRSLCVFGLQEPFSLLPPLRQRHGLIKQPSCPQHAPVTHASLIHHALVCHTPCAHAAYVRTHTHIHIHTQAIITKEEGGHKMGVISITVLGPYMFSADAEGNILVGARSSVCDGGVEWEAGRC